MNFQLLFLCGYEMVDTSAVTLDPSRYTSAVQMFRFRRRLTLEQATALSIRYDAPPEASVFGMSVIRPDFESPYPLCLTRLVSRGPVRSLLRLRSRLFHIRGAVIVRHSPIE